MPTRRQVEMKEKRREMGNKSPVPSWGCELSKKQGNDARLFPNNDQLSLLFGPAGRTTPTAAGLSYSLTQTLLDHNRKHHDIHILSVEFYLLAADAVSCFFSAVRECHLCV